MWTKRRSGWTLGQRGSISRSKSWQAPRLTKKVSTRSLRFAVQGAYIQPFNTTDHLVATMKSMITATQWVPRGHAAAFPTKYVFDEGEYARISKLAKLELDDAKDDLEIEKARQALADTSVQPTEAHRDDGGVQLPEQNGDENDSDDDADDIANDDDLKEYDMEHYDDEPDGAEDDEDEEEAGPNDSIFGNIKGLAYHADNEDDPYLTLPDDGAETDDDEREELQILPTDNLVLAARIEDEVAHLETYVY